MNQETKLMVLYSKEGEQLRVIFTPDVHDVVLEMLHFYFPKQLVHAVSEVHDIRNQAGQIFPGCHVVTIPVAIQDTIEFMVAWETEFKRNMQHGSDMNAASITKHINNTHRN